MKDAAQSAASAEVAIEMIFMDAKEIAELYTIERQKKERYEEELKELRQPFLDRIEVIEQEMVEATAGKKTGLEITSQRFKHLGEELLESWNENMKATLKLDNGMAVTRSKIRSVNVHSTRELLEATLDLVGDESKLPFRINWDNKMLMPLIEAGVIPKDLTSIETRYRLAIKKPKA